MDINELADVVGENEALNPLMETVTQIMEFDEKLLTPQMVETLKQTIYNLYTPEMKVNSTKELIRGLEAYYGIICRSN